MNAPLRFDTASPAALYDRILAGDLTGLPEHITDDEWRELARDCRDCENEEPLRWEIERGRLLDSHAHWQRMARDEREAMRRNGMSIDENPSLSHAWFALHPLKVTEGMAA